MDQIIRSNLVDLEARSVFPAEVSIEHGKIAGIARLDGELLPTYILPGFIDAHVHIESSMLIPSAFAQIAVIHGTVATISDPHEIANVLGIEGVDFMIENGKKVPFHFFFGAPSCVPATPFETAGAVIDAAEIEKLMGRKEILYLAEMMNYPGVINGDPEVLAKIAAAKKFGKPVDGHAPGLRGEAIRKYIAAGISTDHECFLYDEAREKLQLGMKVLIREGSAAKNFDELIPLLSEFPGMIMFCSDDKHPDDLIGGHVNLLVKRALSRGCDLFDVLRAASWNVVKHYSLPVGLLQKGDNADFIEVDDLEKFTVLRTYINGNCVADKGRSLIPPVSSATPNKFHCKPKVPADFKIPAKGGKVRVIEVQDGQLITGETSAEVPERNGWCESDIENDNLKIAVVNRYEVAPVSVAFIKNFGLKRGAIASCVAHDCHNIVVVGTSDEEICAAVNLIIENKGGISLADGDEKMILPLPIAGIMTNAKGNEVAALYTAMDKRAKSLGSRLQAPYMSLSFMALLVIPKLKLSDKGLFDGKKFEFVDLFPGGK